MLIAGNWKMFKTPSEASAFCRALRESIGDIEGVDVAVCPPYVSLANAIEELKGSEISVYAQNVHWAENGAFTGEISTAMLKDLGADGSIVGHSERRQFFGETDLDVAKRAKATIDAGLKVIACVGELESERDANQTEAVLARQMAPIVKEIGAHERLVIAYEPVWAIGTGKTATPAQAEEAHAFIRGLLDVPILYGGSVKADNAAELMSQPNVNGALVGGASLDVGSFVALCAASAVGA
ncbi:MAG TPA: triose-phosphate isomerase [Gaiellaceae bacterium]|jgi:triosephosphate isomerase (TIM)